MTQSPGTMSLTSLLYSDISFSPILKDTSKSEGGTVGTHGVEKDTVVRALDLDADGEERTASGGSEFALDYNAVAEEAKPPCSKWPNCTFGSKCRFSHPTKDQLRQMQRGTLVLKAILPLILPSKNHTIALDTLRALLNKRRCHEKKVKPCSIDDILKILGLPIMRDVLQEFALAKSSGTAEKCTSDTAWSKRNKCYFAVIKRNGAFLLRYYQLSARSKRDKKGKKTKDDDYSGLLSWGSDSDSDSNGDISNIFLNVKAENEKARLQLPSGNGPATNPLKRSLPPRHKTLREEDQAALIEADLKRFKGSELFNDSREDRGGRSCIVLANDAPRKIIAPGLGASSSDGSKMERAKAAPITPSNKGFALLSKMGWKQGTGLGKNSQGLTSPVVLASQPK